MTREEYEQKIWSEMLDEERNKGGENPFYRAAARSINHMIAVENEDVKPWDE